MVRDLESGRIDGAVLSGMMADYSFLQQPQGKEFAFVGGHLQDDTLFGAGAAIGLRKDDEALRQEINGAIAKILADGTYKNLLANILALMFIPGHNVRVYLRRGAPAVRFLF